MAELQGQREPGVYDFRGVAREGEALGKLHVEERERIFGFLLTCFEKIK